MLAAQTAPETRPPSLARRMKGWLAPKPGPSIIEPLFVPAEPPVAADPHPLEDDAPILLGTEIGLAPGDALPPQILLGDLAPRRPAFGQRSEPVLELSEPAPVEPRRLTLMAEDGAAVGEIILRAPELHAPEAEVRRPFEPLHSEVPFFPDDLADEPKPLRKAPPPKPQAAAAPNPELAAIFLLAKLAARLASEEETVRRSLEIAGAQSWAA